MKLPRFELERFFAPHEFSCRYNLCGSDSETLSINELLDLAGPETRDRFGDLRLSYTETRGHPELRQEIAGLYKGVHPDQVLVFVGAEEAIFVLSNVLLGREDHVVVVWPAYQSLHEVARGAGAQVDMVELRHEEGWRLDPERIKAAMKPNTKLVVINFPHNPTGSTITESDLRRIVEIVEDGGAMLLSDEVYRFSEYDGKPLPAAADLSDRSLSLGVMSKSFGLPGLRIGWLVCKKPDLMRRLAEFKDYTTICPPAPSELLATIALQARDKVLSRTKAICAENVSILRDFFAKRSDLFEWVEPAAGCIAFPKLLGLESSDRFAQRLLDETGVLLMPGSVYGHGGNHFRIGYGRKDFGAGLALLDEYLNGIS